MKKGFTLMDFIIIIVIVTIIGVISSVLVISIIKNMKKDGNKILIDNYANDIIYVKEVFMKNNDNNIPKYCSINNDIVYYDENFNNKYDSNELLCNKECDNDSCIKYFITQEDIKKKDIKCNRIIIEDNIFEISHCYIKNKEITNYQYKLENSVE